MGSTVLRGMALIVAVPATALLAGCSDGSDDVDAVTEPGPFTGCEIVSASADPPAATVNVQLLEWAVQPDTTAVAAGTVRFTATNTGTDSHELVVVRADNVASLPKAKDGTMAEEELADGALTGEIEEFPHGENCSGVFDLSPGRYLLLCNLFAAHEGNRVAHLKEGMATTLVVS